MQTRNVEVNPYIILHDSSILYLEDKVREYYNRGYRPTGGVSIDDSDIVPEYMQAMALRETD